MPDTNNSDEKNEKDDARTGLISRWGWELGTVFVLGGAVLTYAIEVHNWKLAQLVSIAGVVLLSGGVALLSKTLSSTSISDQSEPTRSGATEKIGETRDKLLRRLVMVAGFGLGIILLYSVQYRFWPDGRVLSTLSVGLVSAGAAWLAGALFGFLFGIPHTREGLPETPKLDAGTAQSQSDHDRRYAPSTSLEQISDWLTKIIVGVGLTQLNNIPHKLDQLAQYVAGGLADDKPNAGFALGIVLYFSVCGFLFGYLWGRLYMLGLFREADLDKKIKDEVEKISTKMLDQRAKDLVERQLDPGDTEVALSKLEEAISRSSDDETKEILELVRDARKGDDATDGTRRRAIPVLRALIAADKANIQHRYHSELAYILRDFGEREESLGEFTKAIDIRDRRGKSGWKSYEFERARAQIWLDGAGPSAPDVKARITKDLRAAWSDPKLQDRINKPEIIGWLDKNALSIAGHIGNP